jgi:uncharacterized phage protein (TIGR02218 family)
MKSVSGGMLAHLQSETTTLCTCWRVQLQDGTVYGFTTHVADVVFSGTNYLASTGQNATAITSTADLAVDNLDVEGFLDSAVITEQSLKSGRWDYAQVEIFQLNWANTGIGRLNLRFGRLGEIRVRRNDFVAEIRGLAQNLQQTIGQISSASCRADFGDARCKKTLGPLTVTGTVTTGGTTSFTDSSRGEALDYFGAGRVTFTSGQNNGQSMEIKAFAAGGVFTLQLPLTNPIAIGDTYSVIPGCRKRFQTDCVTKWANGVNFRGEPHSPGNNQLANVGGA